MAYNIGLLFVGSAQAQLANTPWPKWQRDLRNSGWAPAVGHSAPTVKWKVATPGYATAKGVAIGRQGEVYIGWNRGFRIAWLSWAWRGFWITRVSAEGAVEWNLPILDRYASFPCLAADGIMYVADGDGDSRGSDSYFYAVTDRGRFLWGPRQDPPYGEYHHNHFTLGPDGTLYTLDLTSLIAIRPADGSLKWRVDAGGRTLYDQCPSIGADGTIYFGHSTGSVGEIWAVRSDGSRRWRLSDSDYSSATGTSQAEDGTAYVSFLRRDEALLTAVTPDGRIAWQAPLVGEPVFPPSIDPEGRLYLQTYSHAGGELECYDATGARQWDILLPAQGGWARSAVVIDGANNLYMILRDDPSYTTRLLSYDPDGNWRWQYDFYWPVGHQVPVIGPDGTLYFTASDEPDGTCYLYAFGPGEAPDPAWAGRQ